MNTRIKDLEAELACNDATIRKLKTYIAEILRNQWRPINTAPRTGEHVLVYSPEHGYFVAWWDDEVDEWTLAVPLKCNPRSEIMCPIDVEVYISGVTHWCQIPPPPGA